MALGDFGGRKVRTNSTHSETKSMVKTEVTVIQNSSTTIDNTNSTVEVFTKIDEGQRNGRTFDLITSFMDSLVPRCVYPCTKEAYDRNRCCETVVLPPQQPPNVCCQSQPPLTPMPQPPLPPPVVPPHPQLPYPPQFPQQPQPVPPPFRPPYRPYPYPPQVPPAPQPTLPPFRPPASYPQQMPPPPPPPQRPPILVAPAPTPNYPFLQCCTSCPPSTYGYYGPPPCQRNITPGTTYGRARVYLPPMG
ncbi:nematocyst expressed protein 4-like [Musca domestica]|uniref:Nematocyst expressed protein 4-like n=1 Tax=Musca domestica TaxID=7370 RepID=A0ABM3UVH4_MUSDO|nr:nematocyst expressed protein 4-like [Musca domestica]